jgi:hypothetical protein
VSCSEALRKQKEDAAPLEPEERSDARVAVNTIQGQLGYRLGYHHAMDDAIEIAEEEEES